MSKSIRRQRLMHKPGAGRTTRLTLQWRKLDQVRDVPGRLQMVVMR